MIVSLSLLALGLALTTLGKLFDALEARFERFLVTDTSQPTENV